MQIEAGGNGGPPNISDNEDIQVSKPGIELYKNIFSVRFGKIWSGMFLLRGPTPGSSLLQSMQVKFITITLCRPQ